MYLEFEDSMFLLAILVVSFGYLIWKVTDCKLDKSFSLLLLSLVIIFLVFIVTVYTTYKKNVKMLIVIENNFI